MLAVHEVFGTVNMLNGFWWVIYLHGETVKTSVEK